MRSVRAEWVQVLVDDHGPCGVRVKCGNCGREYVIDDRELAKILSETDYGLLADDFIELGQCPKCKTFNHI